MYGIQGPKCYRQWFRRSRQYPPAYLHHFARRQQTLQGFTPECRFIFVSLRNYPKTVDGSQAFNHHELTAYTPRKGPPIAYFPRGPNHQSQNCG